MSTYSHQVLLAQVLFCQKIERLCIQLFCCHFILSFFRFFQIFRAQLRSLDKIVFYNRQFSFQGYILSLQIIFFNNSCHSNSLLFSVNFAHIFEIFLKQIEHVFQVVFVLRQSATIVQGLVFQLPYRISTLLNDIFILVLIHLPIGCLIFLVKKITR